MQGSERPEVPEYRLRLDIDFEGRRWTGTVEFDLPADRGSVVLDSDGLEIRTVERNHAAVPFEVEPADQRLRVVWEHPGASTVRVDFAGRVVERSLVGLYRCAYGDGYLLTTQCAPIGARRVFPCIDRPDRKSRIRLSVRTLPTLEVVSNMLPEAVRDEPRRREWVFAPTPTMPAYLFYLAVGRFDRREAPSGRVRVRALTPPGRGASGTFAADSGARILSAYEEYYGLPYPLPKLDLVAVSDLGFGAMENWGAITFREMRLLIDATSASFARRDAFETIAHEIAHQWFGNLVTMQWWDDIWLNESFATFLENKITERLAPEYRPLADFILRPWGMIGAREEDSLRATHPVRAEVARPEEVSQIFDAISYGKGSSVLRMLEQYLGEEPFRTGVSDYLRRFAYRNARTADLWEALERSSGLPVGRLVAPWIDRPGLPVVSARLVPEGLELRQRRFSFHGASDEAPWPIPLEIDVGGERRSLLFDTAERTLPIAATATVHLNPGAFGFYRAEYDPILLERLLEGLSARPPVDRWTVLNDLAAFLVAGSVDWTTYARAIRLGSGPPERLVVEEVAESLGSWALAFPSDAPVQELLRPLLAEQIDRLGLERRPDDGPDAGIVREALTSLRVRVDASFARELAERFVAWDRLDPDLRTAVAIARVRTEGESGYRELERARPRAETEVDRLRLETALAWTGVPSLVAPTLDRVLTGAIPRGHFVAVVRHVATNPVGRPQVGPWLEANLPRLEAELRGSGAISQLFEDVLPWVGVGDPDATRRRFRVGSYAEGTRGLAKGLERLEILERVRRRWTG